MHFRSSDIQHLFHALGIRFADDFATHQLSHALAGFLGQDVTGMAVAAHDLPRPGNLKSFCCTLGCFPLHSISPN
jgi:hypothetical protein